MMTVLKKV